MISEITIRGLAAHENTHLKLAGLGDSIIEGASEQGKTLVIDAVCFALYGWNRFARPLEVAAIHDDADEVSVEILFEWGVTIRRVLRKGKEGKRGKTSRFLGEEEFTTEKVWLGRLKTIGSAPKMVVQVMAPMAWQPLVAGEGRGRPFRDLLARLLPKSDKVHIIKVLLQEAGFAFKRGDPINPDMAEMVRRQANTRREKARGKLDGLTKLLEASEIDKPTAPSTAEVHAATAVVELVGVWRVYQDADDSWTDQEERRARAYDAAEGWDTEISELGDRPDGDGDAIAEADAALTSLRTEVASLQMNIGLQSRALEEAEEAAKDAATAEGLGAEHDAAFNRARREQSDAIVAQENITGVCPKCQRDGWEGALSAGAERVQFANREVDRLEEWATTRRADLEVERTERMTTAKDAVEVAQTSLNQSTKKQAALAKSIKTTEGISRRALRVNGDAVEWDRRRKTLGERPAVPEAADKPEQPEALHPSMVTAAKATQLLEGAKKAEGATAQRNRDVATLNKTRADAAIHFGGMKEEAARLDALVNAVRKAPSVAARKQLGALGDLGPVKLDLTEEGGVTVLVDGRPYHLASTGRVVVADAWLRAGLRRALKMPFLPLFVDNTQAVGGMDVPRFSPTILLKTTDSPNIEVTT